MNLARTWLLVVSFLLVAVLSGCDGGDDDETAEDDDDTADDDDSAIADDDDSATADDDSAGDDDDSAGVSDPCCDGSATGAAACLDAAAVACVLKAAPGCQGDWADPSNSCLWYYEFVCGAACL